jgi:hypothetical protein
MGYSQRRYQDTEQKHQEEIIVAKDFQMIHLASCSFG